MVLIVPLIGNDCVPVCAMGDSEFVGEVAMREADDEVEAVMYPSVVEEALETTVELEMGIGENGWVVNVTRFGGVVVYCARELSGMSVVEHSVGVTKTVVVTRVVKLPSAAEVSADSGASVTVGVEYVVEEAMAVGRSVTSAPLVVEVVVAASVVGDSLSDKLSPSGMLTSGMSEAAGVLVTVGVPVSTAPVVVVATDVLEASSPPPPFLSLSLGS
jgi:hypothetical protein